MSSIDENEIAALLFRTASMQRYIHEPEHKNNLGFYMGQYRCLFLLAQADAVSQKELAETMGIRPASLSELLHKLEEKGFARRTTSDKDRRVTLISLTEAGMEEVRRCRARQREVHRDMFSVLSDEEKEQLYHILHKINQPHGKER
ncbi:MAG: MarR family transcriptional regulator [Oscillospiraceae bacterium]|nr:MarR family transcriptional regulator [Oscillospiraceae bacterium]